MNETEQLLTKALERYKSRLQEVEAMGWYKDEAVTQNEIARIDSVLAGFSKPNPIANASELLEAAQEAWTIWDHRPSLIFGDKVNPRSKAWMMAQRAAMNNLGAALLLAGADLRTPREGKDE